MFMVAHAEKTQTVKEILQTHKTAMLVTHDIQGGLVSRPMTTQAPTQDGEVWFFVSSDADVLDEIKANSEVNVAYSKEQSYVSLSGTASIVDDVEKKKELWYEELEKWFDGQGPESNDVLLIKVSADTARFWDSSRGGSESSKSGKNGGSPMNIGKVTY